MLLVNKSLTNMRLNKINVSRMKNAAGKDHTFSLTKTNKINKENKKNI